MDSIKIKVCGGLHFSVNYILSYHCSWHPYGFTTNVVEKYIW